jgi:DNA invertase Pin-like site-specific DNA recombinase
MKRAALYARFSTDLQNERSVDDQFVLCRAYAAREGFTVTKTYADHARSAASLLNRDGILSLMEDGRRDL